MAISMFGTKHAIPSPIEDSQYTYCPKYKVSAYGDEMYRVVKMHSQCVYVGKKERKEKADGSKTEKFYSAMARARTATREYGLCNKWDYFVTLTLNKEKVDRYNLRDFLKEFLQWIQNQNKQGAKIQYLLVPEKHQDGAWHLHGLMNGIKTAPQPVGTPKSIVATGYECWIDFSNRYGYSTISPVVSNVGCGFYITKYITKTLADLADMYGIHCYYHSRGLEKSYLIGYQWLPSPALDKFAKYEGRFCDTGFFKVIDVGYAVDLCDDVADNYHSYVLTDPTTDEVITIAHVEKPEQFWEIFMGE